MFSYYNVIYILILHWDSEAYSKPFKASKLQSDVWQGSEYASGLLKAIFQNQPIMEN